MTFEKRHFSDVKKISNFVNMHIGYTDNFEVKKCLYVIIAS